MFSSLKVLSLAIGAVVLLAAGGERPKFHNVHEGTEASSKLPYEFMYSNAVPLERSSEGRALLEGCIEAYGGREHLARLECFRMVHDFESSVFESGPVERTVAGDRQYRIAGAGEVRTLDGAKAWLERAGEAVEQPELRYRSELFSYLTLRLPGIVDLESFDEPRYATRANDPLGYLYFDKPDTLLMVVGIDPQTHLIRSSEGVIRQGDGNVVFVSLFEGHKEFDGYVFPTSFTSVSLGMEVGKSELRSVDVNCSADEFRFGSGGGGTDREGD